MQQRVIYLDVLFLFNLIVNYLLLTATGQVLRLRPKRLRLLMGAAVGALYSAAIYLPALGFLYSFLMKLLMSAAIAAAGYGFKSVRRFLKVLLCFYAVCFAFGGGITALYFFFGGGQDFYINNGVPYINISAPVFTAGFLVTFAVIWLSYRLFSKGPKSEIAELEIYAEGGSVRIPVLLDTGNRLVEPISQNPVVVAEYDRIKSLIPEPMRPVFECGVCDGVNLPDSDGDLRFAERFRAVPYSSVGSRSGLLPAFRPDKIVMRSKNATEECCPAVVAVVGNALSEDGSYGCLVNPCVAARL